MTEQLAEAVSKRIRALLSKTIENGATEAEALAAATKARELMDRYRLSMTDVEIQSEPVIQELDDRPNKRRYAAADYAAHGICAYCGVRSWLRREHQATRRVWLGFKPDVEMAKYLYAMIDSTIKQELATFQSQRGYKDRGETSSFQLGMAIRINERLHDMAKQLEPIAKTATGTALVVVRNAVVNAAYAQLHLKFGAASRGMSLRSSSAYSAGKAAGERANLSRPLHTHFAQRLR